MKSWTYEQAGVPHLKGDPAYNREITKLIRSTHRPGVMGNSTGFAALFDPQKSGMKDPLLVSSTDGVGTKLEIARLQGIHNTIGIDLVAMCVNDILTCGATPVIFLDYFATGTFRAEVAAEILSGIAKGCREAGCALVGGETAIMPGFYERPLKEAAPQYDLAGFSVGLVERKKVITGERIEKGDVLLGLASSGVHSNGYSLIRKLFSEKELRGKLGREFLTPTKIYVKPVLAVLKSVPLRGIVNITGGGFVDNLPRVIPQGLGASLFRGSWPEPRVFEFIRRSGNIANFEMMRTFNLGIGTVLILAKKDASAAQRILKRMKIASWVMGEVMKGQGVEVI